VTPRLGTVAALAVRAATSTASDPTEATTRAAALSVTDAAGNAVVTLGTLQAGQTAFVAAFAYQQATGAGGESPILRKQVTRLGGTRPIILTAGTSWTVPSDFN